MGEGIDSQESPKRHNATIYSNGSNLTLPLGVFKALV